MRKIKLLVPNMPTTADLLPYLRAIDDNRWYSNFGPLVGELESRLSEHYGGAHVVTTSNGTTALEIALRYEKERGVEFVGFPALTFPATALAAYNVGMTVLFDDVDPDTWCGSYVSTFGTPTKGPGLIDAAGAFGEQNVPRGTTACFSLHATKILGCGEGGYIVTWDAEAARVYRRMTNFGLENGVSTGVGTNAKMSEYHAAVALASLDRYSRDPWLRLWDWYAYELPACVTVQKRPRGVYPMMVVKLPVPAQGVLEYMARAGIECRRWYYPPVHRHPLFHNAKLPKLPVTEDLAEHLIGLPWHLWLTRLEVRSVCRTLTAAVSAAQEKSGRRARSSGSGKRTPAKRS